MDAAKKQKQRRFEITNKRTYRSRGPRIACTPISSVVCFGFHSIALLHVKRWQESNKIYSGKFFRLCLPFCFILFSLSPPLLYLSRVRLPARLESDRFCTKM
ncbi:hypothetical protein ES288_A11G001900v1 [Gossypium darwinii]|uniref:Uncharacterized protein n=2 Tax=Gossypium TaxID=3633 RepID=A0A5D2N599_GOSTO|nr:hypothetical protein ES288_A11G001900v1 [Gossypium darwinii]TYH98532.1 hypothetical protein ES332_A11G002900v1 [Gossypium tomentosum]